MSVKCKLLIITDTYVGLPGGSERHLLNFLSHIDQRFDVTAIQMIPTGNPMLADGLLNEMPHVRLLSRPLQRLYSFTFIKLMVELYGLVRREKIDVVVSYHEKADVVNFILSRLPGIRVASVSSKRDLGFKLSNNLRRLMRVITHRFDAVTSPSTSIRDMMTSEYHVAEDKAIVVANGVDLAQYQPADTLTKTHLRAELNLPLDKKLLAIVGSLSIVKGHAELFEAMKLFEQQFPQRWQLLVIGDGELETDLKQLATHLKLDSAVQFVGHQSDIAKWLSAVDVVISASHSEGLSNALIEAAACGLPIIATRVGGNPEIVSHDINGILVDAADVNGFYLALKRVEEEPDLLGIFSHHSRRKAENEFSIAVMVQRLQALYLRLKK